MKKILTLLIGLIGAPLVAYAAWHFCFMLFTCGVSLWFVTCALIVFALIFFIVVLFEDFFVGDWITALCNWRNILRFNVEKHQFLTQEEKDFCLEKIENTMKSVAETKIELSTSNINKVVKPSLIKIVSVVLFMIFAMVFWSGHYQLKNAELYGKVICASERIFSTSGEVLATPQEINMPQVIKRGGSMYILYGNEDGIYSLYDLDGKLVECRDY